tara:strand:+ start:332 stop:517 length:186 start_codon:yes stop_codon:yes gene_type:complete
VADTIKPKDYRPENQVQRLLAEMRKKANPLYTGSTFPNPEERFLDLEDRDVQDFVESTGGK